ncbi:(Fe-S)-binding protein [Polyangium sp. y55x31]|uniref:(Fe-S)-binding protein n=1 Tax=Polyangium sp. y55x31 TaxID=3042688 RepID=UPI0024827ABA|nr:(Fe-S)-binding protein [Polyangium sp. y55x31]MDI1480588.1 (Fe-S)-binding protein [Polyangium sp. y55x31]
MLRLPIVATHKRALETCVYCPKLCRAACPVSNAEASETVTPWGKMSLTYFVGRGDVPVEPEHTAPAWACTGCHACREKCDHRNEPATVLVESRADFFARGAAPKGAVDVVMRTQERANETAAALDAIEAETPRHGHVAAGVLVGCSYVRKNPSVARDALAAAAKLVGGPVRAIRSCCGLPSLHAGDREGFRVAAERLAAEVAEVPRLLVVDPGCARATMVEHARVGVTMPREPELLLDLAHAAQDRLRVLPELAETTVRWHQPCQLGRGLGRYDEPRALLAKISGKEPATFQRDREHGECSGAGALLPVTRPRTSEAIADARIAEHKARGGGLLVTACASSLRRFRSRGEQAEDLVSLLARALAP